MPQAAHFMPWRLRYIPMFSDINVKEITKLENTYILPAGSRRQDMAGKENGHGKYD